VVAEHCRREATDIMTAQKSVIDELEQAIASKEIGRRAETLRRVTDLFLSRSAELSEDQVALFDDVMGMLACEIESSARASFGQRLAAVPHAPPQTIRALALDDAIEVAAPVLTQSEQLDDATLIEGAKTKSQDHLLAISRRKTLAEGVTDVLVDRGNEHVARSTAANPGARFSEFGYSTLVRRSEHDTELALCVWERSEIPRQHLLRLFADASEAVRRKLEATDRRKAASLRDLIAQASNQIQTESRERSADHAAAHAHVQSLHAAGALTAGALDRFAREGKFAETTIALSILCDLPIAPIERAVAQDWSEQVLVLARAIGLSWETTKAILLLQAGSKGGANHELNQCHAQFSKLQPETAKKVVQFYRMRERAVVSETTTS
jgi:uncharacterized protein (DUF2336 family)